MKYFDIEAAAEKQSLTVDFLKKLLPTFIEQLETKLQAIQESYKAKKYKEVESFAHGLTSVAASVGAYEVSNITKTIETYCKKDSIGDDLSGLLDDLVVISKKTVESIQPYLK